MAVVFPYIRNPTWADGSGGGTPINAAKLNLIDDGILNAHQQPAVRVYHNANQSITNSIETSLAFNSERIDQAGGASSTMHDPVTNNSRLTAIYAGVYMIGAGAAWPSSPTSGYIALRLNGATRIAIEYVVADHRYMSVTTMYALAVNDYVECRVLQGTAGALNCIAEANTSPEFWMVRVA